MNTPTAGTGATVAIKSSRPFVISSFRFAALSNTIAYFSVLFLKYYIFRKYEFIFIYKFNALYTLPPRSSVYPGLLRFRFPLIVRDDTSFLTLFPTAFDGHFRARSPFSSGCPQFLTRNSNVATVFGPYRDLSYIIIKLFISITLLDLVF